MEEKKNCYEELEGKTIVWFENSGKEYEGYVAGCDYDIGITIVDAEDKEHNLTCLNGPYSPNKEGYDPEWYDEFFLTTVDMIIKVLITPLSLTLSLAWADVWGG